jgi:hypothetical protein
VRELNRKRLAEDLGIKGSWIHVMNDLMYVEDGGIVGDDLSVGGAVKA